MRSLMSWLNRFDANSALIVVLMFSLAIAGVVPPTPMFSIKPSATQVATK